MKMLNSFLKGLERKIRESTRSLVWLALLLELLTVAYFVFLFLFSLEMLLPTFVSSKISLIKFFSFLFLFTLVAVGVGRMLFVQFSFQLPFRKTLFVLSALWFVAIMLLAFLKFPFWALPVLLVSALTICYLFIRLLVEEGVKD